MSVGFQMEFSVVIKGQRKDIQQIPAVARQIVSEYKTARKHKTSLLSANCFEDMTR